MFHSLIFTALATPSAFAAANDDLARPADRAAIMMTVRGLIDALRNGDAQGAFGVLSHEFQTEMVSPRRFISTMRRSSNALCTARDVEFDALSAVNGVLVQEMILVGSDGFPSTGYFLVEQNDEGVWQVGSCIVDDAPAAMHA